MRSFTEIPIPNETPLHHKRTGAEVDCPEGASAEVWNLMDLNALLRTINRPGAGTIDPYELLANHLIEKTALQEARLHEVGVE